MSERSERTIERFTCSRGKFTESSRYLLLSFATLWKPAPGNHSGTRFTVMDQTPDSPLECGKEHLHTGNASTRKAPGTIARDIASRLRSAATKYVSVSDLLLIPYVIMSISDPVRLEYGEC